MDKNWHFQVRHEPATGAVKPWEVWAIDNATGRWLRKGNSFKTQAAAQKRADYCNKEFGLIVPAGEAA